MARGFGEIPRHTHSADMPTLTHPTNELTFIDPTLPVQSEIQATVQSKTRPQSEKSPNFEFTPIPNVN